MAKVSTVNYLPLDAPCVLGYTLATFERTWEEEVAMGMQEIRKRLAEGATPRELITEGYARSSVYAELKLMRRRVARFAESLAPKRVTPLTAMFDCGHEYKIYKLGNEISNAIDQVASLDNQLRQSQDSLNVSQGRVATLEAEISDAQRVQQKMTPHHAAREEALMLIMGRIGALAKGFIQNPPGTAWAKPLMESKVNDLLIEAHNVGPDYVTLGTRTPK